jgi:hypothetical protein
MPAGVSQAFAPAIDNMGGDNFYSRVVMQTAASATLGGTASYLSGGSFANGAVTAAFGRLFNDLADHAGKKLQAPSGPKVVLVDQYDSSDGVGQADGTDFTLVALEYQKDGWIRPRGQNTFSC